MDNMQKVLNMALSQYGVSEITGARHNETIVNYFKDIGFSWVQDDETAWCSAFMNWVTKQCDLPMSKKLDARSWLKVGDEITEPKTGDLVIFWRDRIDSWKGHIAIYIREDENFTYVLGGNQSNQVCIKPYYKKRVLGYRRFT